MKGGARENKDTTFDFQVSDELKRHFPGKVECHEMGWGQGKILGFTTPLLRACGACRQQQCARPLSLCLRGSSRLCVAH